MTFIEKVAGSPLTIILAFLVALFAIKEIYEIVMWWKSRADGYHKYKSDKEDFEQKVCDIACTSEKHTEALEKISDCLDRIDGRLEKAEEDRKSDLIANGRATLYHLYEKLKDSDTISPSAYETVKEISRRYLAAGGNSIMKDKIIPELLSKKMED